MTEQNGQKKAFDCVEMKRKGQEVLRARLAGMTPEQQVAYWSQRNREFEARIRRAREEPQKKLA